MHMLILWASDVPCDVTEVFIDVLADGSSSFRPSVLDVCIEFTFLRVSCCESTDWSRPMDLALDRFRSANRCCSESDCLTSSF